MAHFAELDLFNNVIRVVTACNNDVANNGGEQSEQAAEYFKSICPLSPEGVKYVQTSYNNNFRKRFAGKGMKFREDMNMFIGIKPHASWTLNSEGDWQAPVPRPITDEILSWDESTLSWIVHS